MWLRRSQKPAFPNLFSMLTTPKTDELVAIPARHGSVASAEKFFVKGMTQALSGVNDQANGTFPVTIYYAFKQEEGDAENGVANTGWETFLEAVVRAGLSVSGTWPVRTERTGRTRSIASNALASSIVLACRRRPQDALTASRREFIVALESRLPLALARMRSANIAPVDLAQAAIGPGMEIYADYAAVVDADGTRLQVREALRLINHALDQVLAEQQGDLDADTCWAVAWFEQHGFSEGEFGIAETLSKAKNTSIAGIVQAGLLQSRAGKVRLLRPSELPSSWDPTADERLTIWEMVHHLVRVLESGGEAAAADLATRLGSRVEVCRELAYRLFTICERKKRAQEAMSYNGLVQSWPEIVRLAAATGRQAGSQERLFS